ncbi:8802_t:CDS:2, partial [Cetraspora pellucida]
MSTLKTNLLLLLGELKSIDISESKKYYSKKKNEFYFTFNYTNDKNPNNNNLIIQLDSKIHNDNENLMKNPKYQSTLSEEISKKTVKKNSRRIIFIISYTENIRINEFIKLKKIITLEDYNHDPIKEQKENNEKETQEETEVHNIIKSMNKLNISDERIKEYQNLNIIIKIERYLNNIKKMVTIKNFGNNYYITLNNNINELYNNFCIGLGIDINQKEINDKNNH